MKEQKDLDQLLESFLSENHVEDAGFSERVMHKVSQKPRIAFLTNLYPMLGAMFGIALLFFTKQSFSMNFSSFAKPVAHFSEKASEVSPLVSAYGMYIAMGAIGVCALYLTFQKERV